jgi:Asparagine synthase (glutamine-hydrolyzing)
MCGLAGLLTCNPTNEQAIRAAHIVQQMAESPSLKWRGPDAQKIVGIQSNSKRNVAHLISTRLAITDHVNPAANMPMFSSSYRSVIIFNGEIYNHNVLRERLKTKYNFRTLSDTEVILAAWEHWGTDMFSELEGMYSFCLIDLTTELAILAVDPAGQKPLYYFRNDMTNEVIFASDIDTILRSGQCSFDIDPLALQEVIVQRYTRNERTHIHNVKRLMNGTYLTLPLTKSTYHMRTKRYFYFKVDEHKFKTLESTVSELSTAIIEAHHSIVQSSELPPMFLLSGGIDSSALVALAHTKCSSIEAVTLGFSFDNGRRFPGEIREVRQFVEALANKKTIDSIYCKVAAIHETESETLFDRWIERCPVLLYNRDALFLYRLFEEVAASGYKIAITGTGPDEIFDGYGFGSAFEEGVLAGIPVEVTHYNLSKRTGGIDINALLYHDEHNLQKRVAEQNAEILGLYSQLTPMQAAQILNWHTHSQYELQKADIASSLCGIEARNPYYNRYLSQLAFQFPGKWKASYGSEHATKWIFRKALQSSNILSRQIAERPKIPFSCPQELFPISAKRYNQIIETLSSKGPLSEIIDPKVAVNHFITRHPNDDFTEMLYYLHHTLKKQQNLVRAASTVI